MKRAYIWLVLGLLFCVGSIVLFVVSFRPSIEFTGGIQLTLVNMQQSSGLVDTVRDRLEEMGFSQIQAIADENEKGTSLLVSLPFTNDDQVKQVSNDVVLTLIESNYISSEADIVGLALNGPSVSDYMRNSAINALVVGIILIAIYMMFAFATMRKHISPFALVMVTIVTMIFDISIPMGAYALWMNLVHTVTVDTVFIIALLTTMGYSINDTIIILDRIRENTQKAKEGLERGDILYGNIFETSLWQTMRRSLGTSISTFVTVVAMFAFGTSVMKTFAFTMGIGIIAGSLSSIFIAAPLAYILLGKFRKEYRKLS